MAINQTPCNNGDEDYIDMEVCYSISSPPQNREFEFQMCSFSSTYPADELFYKGKLLPLHIPHRLQMVQKLTQGCNNPTVEENSPSESCRVSSELNPDDYFFDCSTEMNRFIGDHDPVLRTSWSRKLKQIKQSLISQKLKASRAYLKSLFSKSGCSVDQSCGKAASAGNVDESSNVSIHSKNKDWVNKYMKVSKKNPFVVEDDADSHRRSFSGVIQRHSTTKSSSISTSTSISSSDSSSFSFGSSGLYDLQLLKRSNSVNSEIESSIEGAIAHCKQSQQVSSTRKVSNEVGIFSLFDSKISISGDQGNTGICSI